MNESTFSDRKVFKYTKAKTLLAGLMLFLSGFFSVIQAQGFDVTGTVKDENGEPIPGANVVLKGENIGVITDISGNFIIHLEKEHQIEISFVGFITETIFARNTSNFDIVLKEGMNTLDEVVCLGYGEQKIKHATYAVQNVSLKKIEDIPATNLTTLIRDQIPGVKVSGGESRPGQSASILIRQPFSWSKDGGNETPLIVIDDVPQIEANSGNPNLDPLNALDVSEIESITVLKDAAAAIYGSRASQGAIVIKTKRGSIGKPKITYSGKYAFNDAVSHSKTMSTYEYGLFANSLLRAYDVTSESRFFSEEELEQMKSINYSWLDEGWKPARIMNHAIGISGGTEHIKYYTGGSYTTQTANMGDDKYDRWNFRSNIEAKVASGITLSVMLSANKSSRIKPFTKTGQQIRDKSYGQYADAEADYTLLLHVPTYIPWTYELNGEEYFVSPALGPAQRSSNPNSYRTIGSWNYFAMVDNGSHSTNESGSYSANLSLRWDIPFVKGLSVRGTYSPILETSQTEQVQALYSLIYSTNSNQAGSHLYGENTNWAGPVDINDHESSRVVYYDNQNSSYQANAYINYSRTIGLHEITAMGSVERSESYKYKAQQYYNDPIEDYQGTSASAGTLNEGNTVTYRWEAAGLSYLGRITYAYADKYLANFIIRSDASTKFAPENYWGTFPSASFGWVPSLESFFTDKINWIDFLKIRYSVGLTGHDNISAWRWMQFYKWSGDKGYYFGDAGGELGGALKTEPSPNRDAHWDKSFKQNIGIDLVTLQNRFSLNYDFFHDKNSEMLIDISSAIGMPISVGGSIADQNYAEIWTWGHEMNLSWRDHIGDFSYRIGTNFQFGYNNIIKKYYETSNDYPSQNKRQQGQSTIYADWGFNVWKETSTGDGILRTQEDIDNYWAYLTRNAEAAGNEPKYFKITDVSEIETGMLAYQDLGGLMQEDSITGERYQEGPNGIIIEDQDYAKLTRRKDGYSFHTSFECSWKSLSLMVHINTSWGSYRQIDVMRQRNSENLMLWNREPFWTDMFDEETNPDGKYPNIAYGDQVYYPSDFWQLPSFRMYVRTLTLAYSVPKKYCNYLHIENVRVNITGNNLWDLYNPYPGKYRNMYDASSVGYPTLRTWTIGVNVTF